MTNDGAVPVSGVVEIALEQNDLAAAEEFYAGVLGFPVVERWHRNGEAVWVMAGERTRIGLWKPQLGLGGGRGRARGDHRFGRGAIELRHHGDHLALESRRAESALDCGGDEA